MDNLSVIYIAGVGRSGSTLLDRVLGTLDGVTSLNEIYRVWEEGFIDNRKCACGEPFKECGFWREAIRAGFAKGIDEIDAASIFSLHNRVDHSRYFFRLYRDGRPDAAIASYRETLRQLYFGIAEAGRTEIIVDSSKVPSRALLLHGIKGISVHVIHLLRDPRAVFHAWAKRKKIDPASGAYIQQNASAAPLVAWMARNYLSDLLLKRIGGVRVRYEDLVESPEETMGFILERLPPLRRKRVRFVDGRWIELHGLHSIGGNPDRFVGGLTEISKGRHHYGGLTVMQKILLAPQLRRYGYGLW